MTHNHGNKNQQVRKEFSFLLATSTATFKHTRPFWLGGLESPEAYVIRRNCKPLLRKMLSAARRTQHSHWLKPLPPKEKVWSDLPTIRTSSIMDFIHYAGFKRRSQHVAFLTDYPLRVWLYSKSILTTGTIFRELGWLQAAHSWVTAGDKRGPSLRPQQSEPDFVQDDALILLGHLMGVW